MSFDIFGRKAQKFNYKKLLLDLQGDDEDIHIFALRTIIKLKRGSLKNEEEALAKLTQVIENLMESWPAEVRFYGQSALSHLKALSDPPEDDDGEDDLMNAEIILEELDSEDLRVVVRCIKRIEAQEYSQAVDKIDELLEKSKDPLLLSALLNALSVVGSSKSLFNIKKFISHANARVRATCVSAIAKLAGDVHVAGAMIEPFLDDRDGLVRAQAIRYIGPNDFSKVGKAIEISLSSNHVSDRANLAEAVCEIRNDDVIPVLKRLSDDPDDTVKIKLLESIERADHPQKLFILKKLVKDSAVTVRKVAQEAVRRYETKRMLQMGGFQPKVDENAPPVAMRLQSIEDMASQEELDPIELDDLKDPDPVVKLQCLHKIRTRTYERAYQPVIELLGVAENETVLAETLRCLSVIGTRRDVEAVMHFVNHNAAQVRAAAAEVIEQIADMTPAIFLLLPMSQDDDPVVAGVASRALLRYSDEDLKSHIMQMFSHRAVAIRYRLMKFLGHFSGEIVLKIFERSAKDASVAVRRQVVASLYLQPPGPADGILNLLADDDNDGVRTEAARIINARQRRNQVVTEPLPLLDDLRSVFIKAEADGRLAEQEAAEEERRRNEMRKSVAAPTSIVGRLSQDVNLQRELDMLRFNRDVILEQMGQKLYRMIKRKEVAHKAYDKCVFLIDKYVFLEKSSRGEADETTGLWATITKAAGIEKEDEKSRHIKQTLRRQYIELGRIAMELSYKENIIHNELHMDYIELENVEKRIENHEAGRQGR